MLESLNTKVQRFYNRLIGIVKAAEPLTQIINLLLSPERMLSLVIAPEFRAVDEFGIDVAFQFPPTTCESITENDIGTLEAWAELLLKRLRNISLGETIPDYKKALLDALRPTARGGNRQDIVYWLTVDPIASSELNLRKVYPYVGSRDVNAINADDIDGRINGSYVYLENFDDNGIASPSQIEGARDTVIDRATISSHSTIFTSVIHRPYQFKYYIKEAVAGGSSPLGEVQDKILDITSEILEEIRPFVKYVDDIRKDFVVAGQFFQEIKKVISLPPYRWTIQNLEIFYDSNKVAVDKLPQGNIPILGGFSFVVL